MNTMGVGCSRNIWARFVDLRMNQEPSFINGQLSSTIDDESISIQQNEIRRLDSREMLGEWVHPEMVFEDRVYKSSEYSCSSMMYISFKRKSVTLTSHRNVPGDTLSIP